MSIFVVSNDNRGVAFYRKSDHVFRFNLKMLERMFVFFRLFFFFYLRDINLNYLKHGNCFSSDSVVIISLL